MSDLGAAAGAALAAHWDARYDLGADTLSWHQDRPAVSLQLLEHLAVPPTTSVVDVGGGASSLAGELLRRGMTDVTVLDLSARAVEAAQGRLGPAAARVTWVVGDVLAWQPGRTFGLWHDRAVFHFLVDPADRDRYRTVLRAALEPGGAAILGTFALDGPEQCSGLPVRRYDAETLAAELGAGFELVRSCREEHVTPAGGVQAFTWVALRRSAR
jgi:SAM-dependent methyltransferase